MQIIGFLAYGNGWQSSTGKLQFSMFGNCTRIALYIYYRRHNNKDLSSFCHYVYFCNFVTLLFDAFTKIILNFYMRDLQINGCIGSCVSKIETWFSTRIKERNANTEMSLCKWMVDQGLEWLVRRKGRIIFVLDRKMWRVMIIQVMKEQKSTYSITRYELMDELSISLPIFAIILIEGRRKHLNITIWDNLIVALLL